jgi:hypothetical protein
MGSRHRSSWSRIAAGGVVLAALAVAAVLELGPENGPTESARPARIVLDPDADHPVLASLPPVGERPLYPFSVIPGGAFTREEVRRAVHADPVVAVHYASLPIERLEPLALEASHRAYVSYRRGDRVYWTSKKLTLAANEIVLTDGNQMVRARCGNRVAAARRGPIDPDEPDETVLGTARAPIVLAAVDPPALDPNGGDVLRFGPTGISGPGFEGGGTGVIGDPDPPIRGFDPPRVVSSPPGDPDDPGDPADPADPSDPPLIVDPPPPPGGAVPEPTSLLLLASGAGLLLLRRRA